MTGQREERKNSGTVSLYISALCESTYDLDMRAGSDACGNVGGDTLPLPVVILCEGLQL